MLNMHNMAAELLGMFKPLQQSAVSVSCNHTRTVYDPLCVQVRQTIGCIQKP